MSDNNSLELLLDNKSHVLCLSYILYDLFNPFMLTVSLKNVGNPDNLGNTLLYVKS